METNDILVHINESLDLAALEIIEDDIRHAQGVVSAGHPATMPHMIQVVYDTDATCMADIVEDVRGHGLHAQGIGM